MPLVAAALVGRLGWRFGPNLGRRGVELQNSMGQQLATLRTHLQQTDPLHNGRWARGAGFSEEMPALVLG